MGWVCTHQDPCVARMRTRHRSDARASVGRPPTSPIAPAHLSERPACVIGSDAASVASLAEVLEEFAAAEVDRLDSSRASLDRISRRAYGLVVMDAREDDPVAFVNELARRLVAKQRSECAVLVVRDPGDVTPALEHLTQRLGAPTVVRPVDAAGFMAAITSLGDGERAALAAS